ncbi:39S ribosomal protein L22, mitochondrial, variant 3 [Entomophthora muscae]|nr:39S ribosomal protein L22, mitochondrial [Entomophthora muscae]KAJ9082125.1 39S ribosomal protein L22, mitochondrial, variant 3 [Entomophthora muscae]
MFKVGLLQSSARLCSLQTLTSKFSAIKLTSGVSNNLSLKESFLSKFIHSSASNFNAETIKPDMSVSSLFSETRQTIEAAPAVDKFGKPIEREYRFSSANFPVSLQKLTMLANQISGLDINQAILQMQFSQKKASKKIMHNLAFARKNAGLQLNFDPARMYISQAWVGKGNYIKNRIDIKGRGRFGIKEHPYCHIKFIFKEKALNPPATIPGMKERKKIKGFHIRRNVWMPHRDNRPIYTPKPYYNW